MTSQEIIDDFEKKFDICGCDRNFGILAEWLTESLAAYRLSVLSECENLVEDEIYQEDLCCGGECSTSHYSDIKPFLQRIYTTAYQNAVEDAKAAMPDEEKLPPLDEIPLSDYFDALLKSGRNEYRLQALTNLDKLGSKE